MSEKYDYLIVGAGLYGATFAHFAHKEGKKCLLIDQREHTGGNLHCESIEGINVHKYGAHIFHTSDIKVWEFVNTIVPFNNFINSPVAMAENGKLYNLPFNMNTFSQMWGVKTPAEARTIIEAQREEAKEKMLAHGVSSPNNLEEQALMLVGKDLFETLIKGYTEKQWGRLCRDLPSFIIKRLPVRFTFDNNYFNDRYQGIPEGGYNRLIEGLIEGIEVKLNRNFFENRNYWERMAEKIVFTGKIDEFYGYRFGKLEYRTVSFETQVLDNPNFQGNAVVNYTSARVPFTRIIEHKHFEKIGNEVYENPKTVISKEYPIEWNDGMEPYYPINDHRNESIFKQYRELAAQEENVIFGGRLAEYKYYDMAPLISAVMRLFERC